MRWAGDTHGPSHLPSQRSFENDDLAGWLQKLSCCGLSSQIDCGSSRRWCPRLEPRELVVVNIPAIRYLIVGLDLVGKNIG